MAVPSATIPGPEPLDEAALETVVGGQTAPAQPPPGDGDVAGEMFYLTGREDDPEGDGD